MPSDFRQQLRTIWRYHWWLALFVVLTTVVVFAITGSQAKRYEATALVQLVSATEASGDVLPADVQQSLMNTYLQIAQTPGVYEIGAGNSDAEISPSDFASQVTIDPETGSPVFDATGSGDTPAEAAAYANSYASALSTYVDRLQTDQRQVAIDRIQAQIDETSAEIGAASDTTRADQLSEQLRALETKLSETVAAPTDSMRTLGRAIEPDSPTAPKPRTAAALAFIVSLLLGCGAILAYSVIADRYRDADDAAADLGLPLLGEMPRAAAQDPQAIEAFRRLRTVVNFELTRRKRRKQGATADDEEAPQRAATVLITAAERGAGKSYTTAGLARAFATDGWKAVAIDADLRKPTLHEQLGGQASPGLTNILKSGYGRSRAVLQSMPFARGGQDGQLELIAAGKPTTDSAEQLASSNMAEALDELAAGHDYIVLDSPPVLPVVDPVVLSRYADGVVVVVDARHSRRRDVRRMMQTLRATDTRVLGFVFNRVTAGAPLYGYGPVELSATARQSTGAAR
jgi:capsular exopolysaccharide synthesis family protein